MQLSSSNFFKAPVSFGNKNEREELLKKHANVGTQNVRKRFEEARENSIKIDFKDKN